MRGETRRKKKQVFKSCQASKALTPSILEILRSFLIAFRTCHHVVVVNAGFAEQPATGFMLHRISGRLRTKHAFHIRRHCRNKLIIL